MYILARASTTMRTYWKMEDADATAAAAAAAPAAATGNACGASETLHKSRAS